MTLICRLEPEWFLEQIWKVSQSESGVRIEKSQTPNAFDAFLKKTGRKHYAGMRMVWKKGRTSSFKNLVCETWRWQNC